jgi:hypothetical protein
MEFTSNDSDEVGIGVGGSKGDIEGVIDIVGSSWQIGVVKVGVVSVL